MKFVYANEKNANLFQAVLVQNDLCFISLEL